MIIAKFTETRAKIRNTGKKFKMIYLFLMRQNNILLFKHFFTDGPSLLFTSITLKKQ